MNTFSNPNIDRVAKSLESSQRLADRLLPSAKMGSHNALTFLVDAVLECAGCFNALQTQEDGVKPLLTLACEASAALVLASEEDLGSHPVKRNIGRFLLKPE